MARGFDRRRLLGGGCALLALGCAPLPPVDGDDHSGAPTGGSGGAVPGPYPCGQSGAPDGTWTELSFAAYPDLAAPGGWSGVTVAGRSLIVAHVSAGCFAAVDRACAHQGSAIDYRPDRAQFVCPQHGAVYAPDGSKVSGPQPTGIAKHPCVRRGDSVFVRLA
jgi:cytochrome b6-f complex iron-sulfur subunit